MDEILETSFSNACHQKKVVVPQFLFCWSLFEPNLRYINTCSGIRLTLSAKKKEKNTTSAQNNEDSRLLYVYNIKQCVWSANGNYMNMVWILYAPRALQIFRHARSCVLSVSEFDLAVLYIIDTVWIGLQVWHSGNCFFIVFASFHSYIFTYI